MKQISLLILLLLINNCSGNNEQDNDDKIDKDVEVNTFENLSYEKKYDYKSGTYYYLTRVNHKDSEGQLLKLQLELATEQNGETVPNFAKRKNNPLLAINASMGLSGLPSGIKQVAGRQVINGAVVQDLKSRNYTLGIRDNNELLAYPPDMTAQDILDDGTNNALTCFVPLIVDNESVSQEILSLVGNNAVKHPRQVIAQFDNLDLLILSCGGRGYDGQGMTALDLIRILKENKVKFAVNLDGGGSVCTAIKGERITKQIDGNGTLDRPRSNFLFIEE